MGHGAVGITELLSSKEVLMKKYKTKFEMILAEIFGWALYLSVNS
jgi:hypothetical protein